MFHRDLCCNRSLENLRTKQQVWWAEATLLATGRWPYSVSPEQINFTHQFFDSMYRISTEYKVFLGGKDPCTGFTWHWEHIAAEVFMKSVHRSFPLRKTEIRARYLDLHIVRLNCPCNHDRVWCGRNFVASIGYVRRQTRFLFFLNNYR